MANNKRKRSSQDEAAAAPKLKKETKKSTEDWIEALAKKASSAETTTVVSKAERVGRRLAKKRRRDERKPVVTRAPSLQTANHNVKKEKRDNDDLEHDLISQTRLRILADRFRIFQEQRRTSRLQGNLKQFAKKAKNSAKTKWNEDGIQPRRNDYGGIGLARPSLFLPLNDPSFIPKVEEEFAEHIPGFFGKQRTKAMKKQLNGQMLWRKLAENRIDNPKVNEKKLATMTPDERVEALLKAGVI